MKSIFFSTLISLSISWVSSSTTPTPSTPAPAPKVWALLTAGSNGWYNYRHQADICHAYHVLRNHGIPKENIIVMMFDDIANNSNNPTPGVIINEPNGPNVYEGVVKDYTGKDVTPVNFLNILQGKKEQMAGIGSGRVIESGPNDIVFVNFVDHGAFRILGFPDGVDPLQADDLIGALTNMTKENRYSKMFLFIEACESGSMFDEIMVQNTNIFALTASDPRESSWATYCNTSTAQCLADAFSINWMHQAEIENLSKTSLHHLYEKVRSATIQSHVEEYGDLDIGNITNAKIIGAQDLVPNKNRPFIDPNLDAVPQHEAKLAAFRFAMENASRRGNKTEVRKFKKLISDEIERILTHTKKLHKILAKITSNDSSKIKILQETPKVELNSKASKCYKIVLQNYFAHCLNFAENEFMYPNLKKFLVACNAQWTNVERIKQAIRSVCQSE